MLTIDKSQCQKIALFDAAMGTAAVEEVLEYGVTKNGKQTVKFIGKDRQTYIALTEEIRIEMYFTPESLMQATHVSQ